MRFTKTTELLRLARQMQSTREGLSLADIQSEYNVSRRTAERMRDAVGRTFPQMEECPADTLKRWRLPPGTANSFISLDADDLSALATAAKVLRQANMTLQAERVEQSAAKLKSLLLPPSRARLESDLEPLMEAEGLILRAGPRPKIATEVLAAIRHAIKAFRKLRLTYVGRGSGRKSWQVVCPYGLLYGSRHYLVAYSLEVCAFRLFSLANIARAEVLTASFKRRKFSLTDYAARSFGVFQEKPVDVVWRFDPAVAAEATEFLFHPRAKMKHERDGSLLVSFRAGGLLEMAWHLYTWGESVKVLEPKNFWSKVAALEKVMARQLRGKARLISAA